MIQLILFISVLGIGAPTVEDAAQTVASGGDGKDAAMQLLTQQGRFGLSALVKEGRRAEGEARFRVYEAIGAFRGDEAFSALMEGLRATDKHAQLGAIRGLSRIGTARIVDPLAQTAVSSDPEVRAAVVAGLALVGPAAEEAVQRLSKDPSPYARETALRFFARHPSVERRKLAILGGLRDPEPSIRAAAVELADLWRDMALADALVALTRDKDPEVAARAVEALAKFPSMRKTLPELLADPRVTEQAWMTAFHRLRDYDEWAIPYLLAAIAQADGARQAMMFDVLTGSASEEELNGFASLLDSPRSDIGGMVSRVLQQMGARADNDAAKMVLDRRTSLAEAIRTHLKSRPRHGVTDEPEQGKEVRPVETGPELPPSEVRDDLADLLADTETQVRLAAARALAQLEAAGAEAELVRLLDDPKPEVRIEALGGLRNYPSRLSALARMAAIEDPESEVRQAAMRSFEGSGSDRVLGTLERVARSGSPEERLTALTALSAVRTHRAIQLLVALVTEHEPALSAASSAYFDSLPPLIEVEGPPDPPN